MRSLTIIGGGLAGLTLGIDLRMRGVPVLVHEAGAYPRHRVCGEFISGRGQKVLDRLGLRQMLLDSGAILARQTAFCLGDRLGPARPVRPAALCISRFQLDALLARRFVEFGGELRENSRWEGPFTREGLVRATGRQSQPGPESSRWFGLKAHARNLELSADLEMYCLPNQYVGVGRIENGKFNICGLFKGTRGPGSAPRSREELLKGPEGSALRRRLDAAAFEPQSFCAVAALPLRPRRAAGRSECCLGDALTMTPPVTGNGMSMAFEAAAAAAGWLERFSRQELDWPATRAGVAGACDRLFWKRLRWAGWLQQLLFWKLLQGRLGRVSLGSELLWETLFAKTR